MNHPVSYTDVLIVGAGPAGLMAATWLSRCGIKTRIIDKRPEKVFRGQADGLQSRTFEIFDSFGFGKQVWQEANQMLEMCLWNPDEKGRLRRSSVVVDTIPGMSRFQHATLHQGRVEDFFLSSLGEHGGVEVERRVLPESIEIEEDMCDSENAYPIGVQVRYLKSEKPTTRDLSSLPKDRLCATRPESADQPTERSVERRETIKAKYAVGCDGAHSWMRKQLGFEMQGEQTDYIWGVLDVVPITDFPDIRKRCAIHSAQSGSIMIIPRENKLTRIYCQLREISEDNRTDRASITPEMILSRAQQIMKPYKLEFKHFSWHTAYQIGQRVATKFSYRDRIFLAGDAVHTHSPKAGQGMNVSMHDTYNLGWKLASVVKGISDRSILKTYETERRQVAKDLIEFDRNFSRLFSGRPATHANDKAGVSMNDFRAAYEKGNEFTCGLSVEYDHSLIVAKDDVTKQPSATSDAENRIVSKPQLARNVKLGKRMPSYQVLNQADARPWHLQEALKSNGCWRIVVFAGDITVPSQMARIQVLGARIASFIKNLTPSSDPIDSRIEVLTVHSAPRFDVELLDFPWIMRPYKDDLGWEYDRIFVDAPSYHAGDAKAYENYGIDAQRGCLVVVRPDQHVSFVGELEDVEDVDRFFSGFTRIPRCPN